MNDTIPLLRHALTSRSAFTPEALVSAVRAERRLPTESVPTICVLDFDGDLNDWLIAKNVAAPHPSWACFHTSMSAVEVDVAPAVALFRARSAALMQCWLPSNYLSLVLASSLA
jgi:hypothetical protein